MSHNCSYPQLTHNPIYSSYPGCNKCGHSPAPLQYPYPKYPCHPGSPNYPYKPQYPAYPIKPCKECGHGFGCCYPPDMPKPPELDCCCDECGEDGPCCRNGCCAACADFTKNLPYLMPRAIGCGKTERCKQAYCLPLDPECLDRGDLPGRPPHTIVCVKNTGAVVVEDCLDKDNDDDAYDYYVRIKIPVDIIVRDCAGFMHCLKSWFAEKVKIPLTGRVSCLPKRPLIYVRATVTLCAPVRAESEIKDLLDPDNAFEYLDVCGDDVPGDEIISFDKCPRLKVSVAACVIKLVPCGSPDDPYICRPPKLPCKYPCPYYQAYDC